MIKAILIFTLGFFVGKFYTQHGLSGLEGVIAATLGVLVVFGQNIVGYFKKVTGY